MVTARLAIGSVSTLALGALLLGSAPYWLGRHGTGAHAAPWGDVSALGTAQPSETSTSDDRAQLLKLAALKSGASAEASATPPVLASAPVPQADPAPVVQASASNDAMPEQPAALAAVPSDPAQAAAEAPAPQQVASLEDPTPAAAASQDDSAKSDRININTASTSALDHLPGAGRIGHAIVSHRPYKSVKDLVSRRVLRMSDFQKIEGHIGVD